MLRFRKSFKLAPGLRVSIGRRSASASIGSRRLRANVGKRGVRGSATLIPGITYLTKRRPWRTKTKETDDATRH